MDERVRQNGAGTEHGSRRAYAQCSDVCNRYDRRISCSGLHLKRAVPAIHKVGSRNTEISMAAASTASNERTDSDSLGGCAMINSPDTGPSARAQVTLNHESGNPAGALPTVPGNPVYVPRTGAVQ
jgi:hypothetical protein